MKRILCMSMVSALVLSAGCVSRGFHGAQSRAADATGNIPSWTTVGGVPTWRTHNKPTWIFNYSTVEGAGARDPVRYLLDGQAHWTRCQEALRANKGDEAKNGPCSNGGFWRGMGIYFAPDPFVSAAYGNTLVAVRVKPNIDIPSLYTRAPDSNWGDELNEPKKEELWKSDVPGVRYQWGPGVMTPDSIIVRDMAALLVPAPNGAPEVYQFSGARVQRGTGQRAGVSFAEAPSMACNAADPLPEKLKKAVFHSYFMYRAASDIKAKADGTEPFGGSLLDPATKKLTTTGKLWAIASEINARTPQVMAGMAQIPGLGLRGDFAKFTSINNLSMETLEVFIQYKFANGENVDASVAPWFRALGYLPAAGDAGRSFDSARTLGEALAAQWSAQPNAEARALEAYDLARCILDDMKEENMSLWAMR